MGSDKEKIISCEMLLRQVIEKTGHIRSLIREQQLEGIEGALDERDALLQAQLQLMRAWVRTDADRAALHNMLPLVQLLRQEDNLLQETILQARAEVMEGMRQVQNQLRLQAYSR